MTARFVILATGVLSVPLMPDIPGVERFRGESFHTASWPHDRVDLSDRRVAVIGTGATAVQLITEIAKTVGHLTVFQRTPNWCAPLHNGPIDADEQASIRERYAEMFERCRNTYGGFIHDADRRKALEVSDEERIAFYEELYAQPGFGIWMGNFRDVLVNEEANATLSEFMTHKIRERVRDPEVADKLIPTDHGFGTRRVPLESGYYEVFNQPNVELVDVRETPIVEITESGIRTTAATHECDVIIFATGFDAVTGSFDKIEVTGVGGESLRAAWAAGPKTYLGLGVAGFPNLFMLVGPHSAASFCNMPRCIEHNVEWLATLLARHEVGGADARLPDTRRARRVDRRGHRGGAADALLEGRLVVHRHAIAELQGSRANCAAVHRRLPEVPGTVPRRRRRRLRRLRPRLTAHPHDRLSSSGPMRRSGARTPPVSASRDVSEHNHRVRYLFGDTVLDTTRYSLYRNEEPQHVEPQVFDVLAHLVENRNRVVSKNELLDQVWGHQFVTESALTTRIKQLRQAVGDTGKDQRVVQTIHGRGYRFIATVQEVARRGRAAACSRCRRSCGRTSSSAPPTTALASRSRRSARGRPSFGQHTGSRTSTTTGRAQCGGTGSSASRTTARWCATTSAATASPITTSTTSRSKRWCATSRPSSTSSDSSASRSSASRRAAPSRSRTRRAIPSGSAT